MWKRKDYNDAQEGKITRRHDDKDIAYKVNQTRGIGTSTCFFSKQWRYSEEMNNGISEDQLCPNVFFPKIMMNLSEESLTNRYEKPGVVW